MIFHLEIKKIKKNEKKIRKYFVVKKKVVPLHTVREENEQQINKKVSLTTKKGFLYE